MISIEYFELFSLTFLKKKSFEIHFTIKQVSSSYNESNLVENLD